MIEGMTGAADFGDKDAEEQSFPSLTAGWSGMDDVEIPSFVRPWPTTDTPQGARLLLGNIDRRIEWLAERGLRPHPNVIERRAEVAAIVEANAMLESVTQAELQKPTRCLTPLLGEIDRETTAAIEDIAAVTRPPPLKPPEVFPGRIHNPRHRPAVQDSERLGLVRRLVRWLGFGG